MRLASLALATGLLACTTNNTTVVESDGGTGVTPTSNGVFPAAGFAGRDLRVEVSGDATAWSATTTVDFGAGVTVNSVSVASATDLFANITIAPDATPGQQDVVVTDGAAKFTLSKAFEVDAPAIGSFAGTVAQGSIVFFSVQNKDISNPFDATTDPNTGAFINFTISGPAGANVVVGAVDAFSASGSIFIDTDAGAGGALSITSGPTGGTQVTTDLAPLTIAARTATAFTKAAPATGTVANPVESQLFTFVPAGSSLVQFAITSTDDTQFPTFALLPASGHWADGFVFVDPNNPFAGASTFNASLEETAADTSPFFLVEVDTSGASAYPFSIAATEVVGTALTVSATNVSPQTAQATTLPAFITNTLPDLTTEHWQKITITAADVQAGKHIHVVTGNGDPLCDDLVDIFGPGSATSLGESSDANFHEDFQSPALTAAGQYFVEISASQAGFFDSAHDAYVAMIFLD